MKLLNLPYVVHRDMPGWERVRPPRDHQGLCGLLMTVRWPQAMA